MIAKKGKKHEKLNYSRHMVPNHPIKIISAYARDKIQQANSHPDPYHIPSDMQTKNTSAYSLHLRPTFSREIHYDFVYNFGL
jgi:hypothetical protein